jgi:hypothetical protein
MDADRPAPHTLQADFEHFLSYSGLWREPTEIREKLLIAFAAGCNEWTGDTAGITDERGEIVKARELGEG